MRSLVLIQLVCWFAYVAPPAAQSQSSTQSSTQVLASTGSDAQAKPQPADPKKPQPTPAPAPAPAAPVPDTTRSLFDQTWRQFELSGRFSSIDGDPARFQRYGDFRDGLLFTDARYATEDPDGSWVFRAVADKVGWRDQRYAADYERTGRFVISGFWDEIPQFYSVDTATPYTTSGDALVLDDATQRRIQNGQVNPPLSAYVPIAPQFELRERRDVGNVSFLATPTPQLDIKAAFTTNRHVGELPWGASFGFSNDVEVPLPYDSRANDFSLGAEWTNTRNMFRVGYSGSWFDNLDDPLVWDSPLRIDDHPSSGPGRGRMSLWPSNSAQTITAGGYSKFARRTQLTGFVSFGFWNNDEPLQPFTINAALPQLPMPRSTTEASANVFSTNLNLVSRPVTDWRLSARLRRYDYNNETPVSNMPQYVSYDTEVNDSLTGGPEIYAHDRTTFDADATWTGLPPLAVTFGYTRNNTGHDFRIFESTGENVLLLAADAVGSSWVTFRAQYEFGDRTGSGLNEDILIEIHEQPAMRHYDLADRSRHRFTGQMDVVPNDLWTFSFSTSAGNEDYDDSYFGLQESTFRNFSFAADYRQPNGFGLGASYNFERYQGLQQSRSASPGQTPPQETDPRRDWTVDSEEDVNYFSIYASTPRIRGNTEARIAYDYSYAEGSYFYAIPPGSPLTPPNQLPDVFNKLQQLRIDVRHRLTNRLVGTFWYLYEPFRVYDFAFDPTVVNSIVQPSSLVMGYVYRPYTSHTAVFGIRYFW